jgi:hypothetical protein
MVGDMGRGECSVQLRLSILGRSDGLSETEGSPVANAQEAVRYRINARTHTQGSATNLFIRGQSPAGLWTTAPLDYE